MEANSTFSSDLMVFTLAQKAADIWATIVRKFVGHNFKKSPNLVTFCARNFTFVGSGFLHPQPLFRIFFSFEQTLQFFQQINVKNVHPVYGAKFEPTTFRT